MPDAPKRIVEYRPRPQDDWRVVAEVAAEVSDADAIEAVSRAPHRYSGCFRILKGDRALYEICG